MVADPSSTGRWMPNKSAASGSARPRSVTFRRIRCPCQRRCVPTGWHDRGVTTIALFHSVYGLRPAVLATAEWLRSAGHVVVTPDLYEGPVAASIEEGFALSEWVGWNVIMRRARSAVRGLPSDAVLAGLSMGAGVAGELLAERGDTAGVLLLHGIGGRPADVRAGLPVHLHIAEADELFPPADVAAWRDALLSAGAGVHVYTYPGARHFFTDLDTADYDQHASELAWRRSLTFLRSL
jgi:dienelactone hydrolase